MGQCLRPGIGYLLATNLQITIVNGEVRMPSVDSCLYCLHPGNAVHCESSPGADTPSRHNPPRTNSPKETNFFVSSTPTDKVEMQSARFSRNSVQLPRLAEGRSIVSGKARWSVVCTTALLLQWASLHGGAAAFRVIDQLRKVRYSYYDPNFPTFPPVQCSDECRHMAPGSRKFVSHDQKRPAPGKTRRRPSIRSGNRRFSNVMGAVVKETFILK